MAKNTFYKPMNTAAHAGAIKRMAAVLVQERIVEMLDAGADKAEIAAVFGAAFGVVGSGPVLQVVATVMARYELQKEQAANA